MSHRVHRDESGRNIRPDSAQRTSTLLYQLSEVVVAWRAGRVATAQVVRAVCRARAAGATPSDVERVCKFTDSESTNLLGELTK